MHIVLFVMKPGLLNNNSILFKNNLGIIIQQNTTHKKLFMLIAVHILQFKPHTRPMYIIVCSYIFVIQEHMQTILCKKRYCTPYLTLPTSYPDCVTELLYSYILYCHSRSTSDTIHNLEMYNTSHGLCSCIVSCKSCS